MSLHLSLFFTFFLYSIYALYFQEFLVEDYSLFQFYEIDDLQIPSHFPAIVKSPLHSAWIEILEIPGGPYSDQLAVYEINGYLHRDVDEDYNRLARWKLKQLRENFVITPDLFGNSESQYHTFDQIQNYLCSLRINVAGGFAYDEIWSSSEGYVGTYQILDIASESRALEIAAIRMRDLQSLDATEEDSDYRYVVFGQYERAFQNLSNFIASLPKYSIELCILSPIDRMKQVDNYYMKLIHGIFSSAKEDAKDSVMPEVEEAVVHLLLRPLFLLYRQYLLEPYITIRFCEHIVFNQSIYNYTIIDSQLSQTVYPTTENSDNNGQGLFVLDRVVAQEWDFNKELAIFRQYMDIDAVDIDIDRCALHNRYLYR
jgi:hypothetical protein